MTERRAPSARAHLHSAEELPRQWVVLPPLARRAALANPLTSTLFPSHVGFFPNARRHRVQRPTGTDSTIFNYCIRGAGWCELEGRAHDVEPGQLMVLPRAVPHAYGSNQKRPWTICWFHAMGSQVERLLLELGVSRDRPVVDLGKQTRLIELLEQLLRELEEDIAWPTLLYASQLLTHILGLMVRLARKHSQPPDARQRVLSSVAVMKADLERTPDIAELAARAYLSPSHFTALFRKVHGASPKQYLNQLRIHRAAQLLLTTRDDVQSIARRVGFDDPLYFSRVFRKIQGVSPSRYRG